MIHKLMLFLLAVVLIPFSVSNASPVEITRTVSYPAQYARSDIGLSLRLIGGKGSVLLPGRDINLTFQTERDAYVVIYNIDSEGLVQLLYPADGVMTRTRKGKVYFLPEKGKGIKWEVSGKTGIEYIHAVAVTDGDRIDSDELKFLAKNGYQLRDEQLRVDMDPFLAFNLLDEDIIRDADDVPISTDYTYFYINRKVDYPRYLCDKCHGDGNIADPYAMECPEIYIEQMMYDEDDLHYPYPALYAIKHVDNADDVGEDYEEEEYYSSTYYADNVTSDWDDEDYYDDSDSKVYLSVYYTNYDYPYRFNYPAYRSWYYTNYDPWYWDFGSWGFTFNYHWDDYYYHHWPFHSWYAHNYYRYNWGCAYGYYNPWYYNSWHHDYHNRDFYRNSRSIYANRSFTKRALNYTSSSVRTTRDRTLRDSRLGETKLARRDARTGKTGRTVRKDRGNYARGSSPASRNSMVQTRSRYKDRRTPASRVIYGGKSGTGSTRTRDIDRPTSDKGSRTIDRGRSGTRSTGTSTRSRVWRSKRSTEKNSSTGRKSGTIERKSRTVNRSRSSEKSSSDRKAPARSTTRKSSSARKSSPVKKSPSVKRSSSSSSSVRKSTPSKSTSSSSRSSSSSSRSSSSRSSGSSSKSSSGRGKKR